MANETIRAHMSARPHFIGRYQTLADAHAIMRSHNVRHLPVLEGRDLVGVVSQHDLHILETLNDVDPAQVTVDEAMTAAPFVVAPEAPIVDVALVMAERHYGSALVVEEGQVVGVFTTDDALRAFCVSARRGDDRLA